ncbi:thioredoxin family protein [Sphingobacterium tabacisoli]|uniref:Thioredoxin family protein n=1 Tax=Sphingobacterium tabacisoli TaxID=2044855 RepID=A0ABW5KYG9_9SPHI|nr:thioredoxin fold domain-containing protein [Sphingobacterium tabacisoli]
MKKGRLNLFALAIIFIAGIYQPLKAQGIVFLHDYEIALEKAKQENKLIFVDFYTSWCGPCKMLDKEVFSQDKVGNHFNTNFVNLKIQCDDKGVGVELGKKYQIVAYPTLMFLNGQGEVVHAAVGGLSADALIEVSRIAMNPDKNLLSILKKWQNGNRDSDFVKTYFTTLKEAYLQEKATKDFLDFFEGLTPVAKNSKATFELIKLVGAEPFSTLFTYVEDHQQEIAINNSNQEVQEFISKSYLYYLSGLARSGTQAEEYAAALQKFKAKGYPYVAEYEMYCNLFLDVTIENYIKNCIAFLDQYGQNSDDYTLSLTSLLGNLTGRPNQSVEGIAWMETLLKRNPDPRYMHVYFYITWRNHQLDKALGIGEQIRADLIRKNQSTRSIDEQLEMVRNIKVKK